MPTLSQSFHVKGMQLRNRLVMAPMVTGLAEDFAPSQAQIDWYVQHAQSGVGLVVVEACAVAPDALILERLLGIWDDAQVAGLARLAQGIQAQGVPAVLQLVHGGGRAYREDPAQERVGVSPVALLPGPPPRALTEPEIQGIIEAFARAARRAAKAGFDGVEVHAAHYYLLSQFLSPYTNHRTDHWGGDLAGRSRFPVEVVKAVRRAVGPDYPIFCRMHSQENLEGGMSTEDSIFFAQALEAAGVDVLNLSGIGQSSVGEWHGQPYLISSSLPPKGAPGGIFGVSAGRIHAAVRIPVITVGKLAEPGAAQAVLDRDQADLVALARPLIADPMAAEKLLAGRDADIHPCKECLACFAAIRKGPIKCSVNAAV
ncbi:MAG: NADH:flavin oxidoreductase [Holophaga sp.]|nr:NADH:flavin oxidoreductase [Holophaga sp.]